MQYRRLIALLMVCAYLILPLDSFAGHQPAVAGISGAVSLDEPAFSTVPPAGCPCSDQDDGGSHHADGCDTGCSCCSCCSFPAPLPAAIAWSALRPSDAYFARDPIQRFPEVYLPIFVPPQNRG